MAKLKCSTYLPHILSTCSSVFLRIFQMSKTQTVSITSRRMFASTLGRARLFTPMTFARLLRQPIHGFGCVAHKRIYYKGIWCQVFFCSYPRDKCHGNPKGTPLVRQFLLWQLETDGWPTLGTLRELILHQPWTQTYSLRMFRIGS